ncbi:Receptor-like protein EIX2 [Camellia lanceoleosa]|uniref:Receptor-like protein EIX2 n=1 Tax=Camellia lanceoleosa TaxID=1840588 RepID=A0ACC0FYG1_9ERIC|nr:Receptor-like protein EIX2 [Camellia lanceoleosa]
MGTTSSALVMLFALFFIERLEFICSSANSNVSCIATEREALMKIKGHLTDEANCLSSWVGKDCCTWKGVGCSHKTGHVVKLDLRKPTAVGTLIAFFDNILRGQVSPSLLDLNHLHYLDLSWNDIQISNPLGSLKSLRYLDLSGSIFNATIPHHLENLSSSLQPHQVINHLHQNDDYIPESSNSINTTSINLNS